MIRRLCISMNTTRIYRSLIELSSHEDIDTYVKYLIDTYKILVVGNIKVLKKVKNHYIIKYLASEMDSDRMYLQEVKIH